MKYVIDAQLPRQLVPLFQRVGCDAIHTRSLPKGNRTSDTFIATYADREDRIVVTKDGDFVQSHLLLQQPHRLFVIATGNMTNAELFALLFPQLLHIDTLFATNTYLELTKIALIIHE